MSGFELDKFKFHEVIVSDNKICAKLSENWLEVPYTLDEAGVAQLLKIAEGIEIKKSIRPGRLKKNISTLKDALDAVRLYKKKNGIPMDNPERTTLDNNSSSMVEAVAHEIEPARAASSEIETRLKTLKRLRDSGVITEAEYGTQRAKIIGSV